MLRIKIKYVFLLVSLICLFANWGTPLVAAQEVTPTPTPTSGPTPTPDDSAAINDLQSKIKDYQSKLSDLQSQSKTLSSQIKIMDNQIALTELRISATQQEIAQIEKDIKAAKNRIGTLETDITKSTKALMGRIDATYQVGRIEPWQVFLTSNSISNFLTRLTYLKLVQANDKKTIYAAQQAKVDYSNEKNMFETKQQEAEALRKELEGYTEQINNDKASKQTLLRETQGSESNYQRLLSQAQAQLAGFSRFAQSQGGASLLSGQTQCDDWGCYYNQRDSQWGGSALNGTQYSLASDGCLVTSMAMVYTHYGSRGVTPATINSNSSNFASYYPAFLLKRISADGKTSERVGADIDGTLSSGNPVIVGISYDGGGLADHFVVFISGSGGNYQMNDPFTPGGKNISFRERYPSVRIVEYEKVVFF